MRLVFFLLSFAFKRLVLLRFRTGFLAPIMFYPVVNLESGRGL